MRLYNISMGNLLRRKSKAIFLTLGLIVAVSTVVMLVTVSRAMNADIAAKLDEYGANIVIVPRSDDLMLSYGGMTVSGLTVGAGELHEDDAGRILTIKNRDNISVVAPKLLNVGTVQGKRGLVVGVEFAAERRLKKWWSIAGRIPRNPQEVLIGADVRNALRTDVNRAMQIQGETFTVTGILEPTGSQDDGIVFIDLKESQRLFGKENQLSMIEVAARCSDCPIEEIVRQTSEKLPAGKVTAIRQTIESKMEAMHRFHQFSVGLSLLLLAIGALMVLTNMLSSVNERTREIGVYRAIGFRQSHIIKIILTEAAITSLLAGIMGTAAGIGASRLFAPSLTGVDVGAITVDARVPALAIGLALFIGLGSSIFPAYKASRLDPTVALRTL